MPSRFAQIPDRAAECWSGLWFPVHDAERVLNTMNRFVRPNGHEVFPSVDVST